MQKQEDRIMTRLMESFNKASEFYGDEMDSVMADVAAEILVFDGGSSPLNPLTFFDKGMLLLMDKDSECSETVRENIKACLFWWVFNEEMVENKVKDLTESIWK